MRALRFTEFGEPGVLHATNVPDPTGTAREAVIRIEAASVNPSDVKNVAGAMDWTVLPRTPGRDFAGVVISGPPEWQGIPAADVLAGCRRQAVMAMGELALQAASVRTPETR